MADIEKISVGGTSYDVRDANAAHSLTDVAVAGNNVTFEPHGANNVTIVGNVTTTGTSLSNFSSSNYATAQFTPEAIPFAWKGVVKVTSGSTTTSIQRIMCVGNLFMMHFNNGKLHFEPSGLPDYTSNITVSSNTTYYMSIEFNGTDTYTYAYSNDGNTWTTITTVTGSFSPTYTNESTIYLGQEPTLGSYYFKGSVDLQGCYLEINGVKVWEGFVQTGKTKINSTSSVDQTYDSTSTNAQSGVAIYNAGFLRNISQNTSSVNIYGTSSSYASVVTIGGLANAGQSVAVGMQTQVAHNCTAIGYQSNAGVGNFGGATAIGYHAQATGSYAIQIGYGENSTANTLSVGLSSSDNYTLLNSDGTIPVKRIPSTILAPIAGGLSCDIVGSPTISSSYVASGFSDANYLTCNNIINRASDSFELVTAINMTTASTTNLGIFDTSGPNIHNIRLTTSSTNTVRLRISTDGSETYAVDITGTTPLTVGAKVWIKVTYDSTTGYSLYTSVDGTTWVLEGSSAVTTRPYQNANELLMIGDNAATGLTLTGSIYLEDTHIDVNNGAYTWAAVYKPLLNSDGTIQVARMPSGLPKKETYTCPALTSDGTVCTWTVTHTLGTQDVIATVYDTTTNKEIMFDGVHTDSSTYTINITSSTDIASGAYKVVIIG